MNAIPFFEPSDASLVRDALCDRARAFEALVVRYERKAAAIARAAGVPASSLDDVVQEAFLRAFRDLPSLRDPRSFAPWFFRIVRRAAQDAIAVHRRAPRASLEEEPGAFDTDAIERSDLEAYVRERVIELPQELREAVFLYYYEGRSVGKVARSLGISRSAVWYRLDRARQLLRASLWKALEGGIERSLPSAREESRCGRRIAWLALASLPASWPARAAQAANGMEAAVRSTLLAGLDSTISGGLLVSTQKTIAAFVVSALLVAGVGWLALRWLDDPDAPRIEREVARDGDSGSAKTTTATTSDRGESVELAPTLPETSAGAANVLPIGSPALAGLIVDESENAVSGASLIAFPLDARDVLLDAGASSRDFALGAGDVAARLRELREIALDLAAQLPKAISDTDGRYSFVDLAPGEYRLIVTHESHLPRIEEEVVIAPPKTTRRDVQLAGAASISGRVVDGTGQPVAGAEVRALSTLVERQASDEWLSRFIASLRDGTFLAEETVVTTGNDGRFEIGALAPGRFHVSAKHARFTTSCAYDVPTGSDSIEIVLSRGGSIRGVIVGASRRPVEGAQVSLLPAPKRTSSALAVGKPLVPNVPLSVTLFETGVRTTLSASDGAFELTGVDIDLYRLEVSAENAPILTRSVEISEEMPDVNLGVVALDPSRALVGTVLGPNDLPVPGARVWVEASTLDGSPEWGGPFEAHPVIAETTSGPDGRFTLSGLPDGVVTVHAAASTHARGRPVSAAPGSEAIVLRLSEGRAVRGVVRDGVERLPIAGARVHLASGPARLEEPEKSDVTAADGSFEIRGVDTSSSARLELVATHPDYPPARRGLDPGPRDLDGFDVILAHPARISGIVIDEKREPVRGAHVHAVVLGASRRFHEDDLPAGGDRARTDADGRFEVTLPVSSTSAEATYEIFARAEGHRTARTGPLTTTRDDPVWPRIELVLAPASALVGEVVDERGVGVKGAVVRVFSDTGIEGESVAISEGDGAYRVEGLVQGTYNVDVSSEGHAPRTDLGIDVGDGEIAHDVTLGPERTISGVVVDDAGEPVPGAVVHAFERVEVDERTDHGTEGVREDRRHREAGRVSARTNATGAYELRGLPHEVTLVARAPGHSPSGLRLVESDATIVKLVLHRFGAFSGSVVERLTGRPVPIFEIWLKRTETASGEAISESLLPREYVDHLGRFHFAHLEAGTYTAIVIAPGHPIASAGFEARAGEATSHRFELDEGSSVTGVVRDRTSGEGVPGVEVSLRARDAEWASVAFVSPYGTTTDATGAFSVPGVGRGSFDLYVHRRGWVPVEDRSRIEVDGRDPEPVEILLDPAGSIRIEIIDTEDRRVFWRSIDLRPLGGGERADGHPTRHTARLPVNPSRDHVESDSIAPGRYAVSIRDSIPKPHIPEDAHAWKAEDLLEREIELGEVEIRAGEKTTVRFELPPFE